MRTGRKSDNDGLFPEFVAEFAYCHAVELAMLETEISENPDCIKEL